MQVPFQDLSKAVDLSRLVTPCLLVAVQPCLGESQLRKEKLSIGAKLAADGFN